VLAVDAEADGAVDDKAAPDTAELALPQPTVNVVKATVTPRTPATRYRLRACAR